MIVLFRLGLNDLFCSPLKEWLVWSLTLWHVGRIVEKIEVFTLGNGNRTEEKWNFLRWLVVIDWVYICPFSVRSLHLVLLAPLYSSLFLFRHLTLWIFAEKNKGLRISKSDQSVSAMSSVFYATSMNRFHKVPWSVPLMNRCWISHSSMFSKKWGQLWWQK